MPHVLTLQVPVDAPFRALAADAAGRVLASVGAAPEAVEHLRAAVAEAAGAVAPQGTELNISFESTPEGLEVHVSCGTASRVVRQPAARPAS